MLPAARTITSFIRLGPRTIRPRSGTNPRIGPNGLADRRSAAFSVLCGLDLEQEACFTVRVQFLRIYAPRGICLVSSHPFSSRDYYDYLSHRSVYGLQESTAFPELAMLPLATVEAKGSRIFSWLRCRIAMSSSRKFRFCLGLRSSGLLSRTAEGANLGSSPDADLTGRETYVKANHPPRNLIEPSVQHKRFGQGNNSRAGNRSSPQLARLTELRNQPVVACN